MKGLVLALWGPVGLGYEPIGCQALGCVNMRWILNLRNDEVGV